MPFLQGALVILGSLKHLAISVFREVSEDMCFLDTTESGEVFAGVSLDNGTSFSFRFSANSFNESAKSRNRFPGDRNAIPFYFYFWFFVGSRDGFSDAGTLLSSLRCVAGLDEVSSEVS